MEGKPYPCEHAVAIEQEPRHHLVIANEFVRSFAVEIARTSARCAIIMRIPT
jgi:hypothetical protein